MDLQMAISKLLTLLFILGKFDLDNNPRVKTFNRVWKFEPFLNKTSFETKTFSGFKIVY